MISNPRFYKKITNATSKLINCLTPFEEASEDHEGCKAFALSAFQHHRFLDVDGHKVERRLEGLCDKFFIHSKPDKAEILKKLKNSFSQLDISDSSTAGSQIHYALLSILLNLSQNPLNTEYVEPVPQEEEEGELFNWGKYLLEGTELPYPTQWAWDDTPPTSDDDEAALSYGEKRKSDSTFHSDITVELDDTVDNLQNLQLCDDLVPQYWKTNKNPNLTLFGESTCFEVSESCIEEVNLIREVLWLLAGQTNLYAFPFVDGKYRVCAEIISSHATSASISSALSRVARYGDIVQNIRNFVFGRPQQECQTYQAFSESLLHFLKSFRGELTSLERRICLQVETLLLGDIIKILSPRFHELSSIGTVLQNSIFLDQTHDANSKKSSRLLATLHSIILDQSGDGTHSRSTLRDVLIRLWVDSLRPYFGMMDNWMSHGSLIDPYNEFIFQRSTTCPDVESDAFWFEAFNLASEDCMKYLSWLRPVLDSVMVAGKSVEVLVSLGKIMKKDSDMSLHDMFIQNIASSFKIVVIPNEQNTASASCDSMLFLNFERLFHEAHSKTDTEETVVTVDEQMPIPTVIQRSIRGLIRRKSQIADRALLDVFLNEYRFISTLRCFHKFHLMEWGDVMHDFTSSVFRKMSRGEYWEDLMSLRASLQEAISDSDPDGDFSFITVALNRSKQTSHIAHKLIHATDIIELFFAVKWPLNIIIMKQCRESYNSIFGYLMQIKHALFCLENLKFDTISPKCGTEAKFGLQYLHRFALLRSKLLRLVSHWHNFVMTSIIQAEKEVLFMQINGAENVDSIIKAHNSFLERVLTLCLLKETKQADKMIQGTLRKIFNLSVILHMKWNRGPESISSESLKKCEAEYKECSEFLGIILQNLVSRGAVPLSLESLAFCLMS